MERERDGGGFCNLLLGFGLLCLAVPAFFDDGALVGIMIGAVALLFILGLIVGGRAAPPPAPMPRLPREHFDNAPRCLVCRLWLHRDIATCPSCGTPHHRECFEYAGRCALYGCGYERRGVH